MESEKHEIKTTIEIGPDHIIKQESYNKTCVLKNTAQVREELKNDILRKMCS